MNRHLIAPLAALSLLAGAAAPALAKAQEDQGSAASASASSGKAERKICKTFDNSASRMKATKVCLTRDQWKKHQNAN
jgi:hypothetical protein